MENVVNVTRRTLGGCLLSLALRRCRLQVDRKMAMVQFANADSDFAFEPNRDVSNLYVSCWYGYDEPISEIRLKIAARHHPLKFGQEPL